MQQSVALTIPFAETTTAEAADLVQLEQEPEGAYAGRLTKVGVTRYLDWAIYGSGSAPQVVGCGGAPGNLDTAVLVWPLRDDLRYQLFATVGRLGEGTLGEVEDEDTVSFTLTKTATLDHPAQRILSTEWLTGPWTTGGEKIDPPPLEADGREVRTNVTTYGSVRVRYLTRRWRHPLTITWAEAKELLANDNWSEWAVCLPPPGRPVALALTVNRGAEDMAKTDSGCGRRASFRVKSPEPDWPPYVAPEDKRVNCDYCTGRCEEQDG